MPDNLEYIESYFQQTLPENERSVFENRCVNDEDFAKDVAFYIASKDALRDLLLKQKQQQWQQETIEEESTPVIAISKKSTLLKWVMYAAAACVLLIASLFLFEAQTSAKRLASNYIKNYNLEVTMDASHDSLQLGIGEYQNQNYAKALSYFLGVAQRDSLNSDAKKYAGFAYLQLNDFTKALQQFDGLANMKGLQYNSGDFLKAVALIKRDELGDKEAAKALLQKVVNENESEKEKAAEWLKKF